MTIELATVPDAQALADLFLGHITSNPQYISHGEIQMGVGQGRMVDGKFLTAPSPDAREKWMKYILAHIGSEDACVWKLVDADAVVGLCVADIEEDGDEPFGMVCDVLVSESCRGRGAGQALLDKAVAWLRGRGVSGIYLESGLENHSAHAFFEKRGFVHVSNIYKLM